MLDNFKDEVIGRGVTNVVSSSLNPFRLLFLYVKKVSQFFFSALCLSFYLFFRLSVCLYLSLIIMVSIADIVNLLHKMDNYFLNTQYLE